MFDNDGVGQNAFFHPAFQYDTDAARFGQNREQGDIFVITLGHFGQIQRQSRAHHNRVRTRFAGLADVSGVVFDGFHDVDGNHAFTVCVGFGFLDFAVKRGAVESGVFFFARIDFGFGEQVVMKVAQIDAGNRADTVFAGDRAGEFRCGNAHAHPALDDGNQ